MFYEILKRIKKARAVDGNSFKNTGDRAQFLQTIKKL
jgi:hypothetical protein